MRMVLDTNTLVSSLIFPLANSAAVLRCLGRRQIYAPDLHGTSSGRAAGHATKTKSL